jgi:hypothetical protein
MRTFTPYMLFMCCVTSVLRHRTRVILRTSGQTSSTPPTYSGPSPSQHGPTPNHNADHTAHRSSRPFLRPASLHGHAPDQDYALRYNFHVLRARTGLLRYTEPLRRTPDLLRTSTGISTSTSDLLTIPGVLRTTSELIRTTARFPALTSDFRAACQAASPSLMHSVTSPCYSGSPPTYGTYHTPSRSSGSGLQSWVSLRWTPLRFRTATGFMAWLHLRASLQFLRTSVGAPPVPHTPLRTSPLCGSLRTILPDLLISLRDFLW